jgi:S1-C subfamily serine protease
MATVNGIPIYPSYDVIRIQMPITPGASGGPVIADDGDVIGVVSENPTAWFSDLNALIEYGQRTNGGFNASESDLPKLVAKLAWVVQEFVTSGAGLAVPVSYLKQPEPTPLPAGTLKAATRGSQPHLGWFRSLIAHLK